MILELWATRSGRIFWQLDNWHGFYKCAPLCGGRDKVEELPADARPLIADGVWVAGVMEAADEEAWTRVMDPDLPTETPGDRRFRKTFQTSASWAALFGNPDRTGK
ncbi:hypothetical protein E3G52_000326 [Mycobacteroides abscessus]|uniref:hypothetical protein n=1 Tax=Mycobacteroides abscessus TaxID=36809 RepID=UPI0018777289|nr:hypothetical protein [Mycobacteroides abscessus]MBE5453462.1 hypothetical protein [Mycobacteroides abscessus]